MAVLPRIPAPELRVVPNPYVAVDEHGRPCGVVTRLDAKDNPYGVQDQPNHPDPAKRYSPRSFVGAKRTSTRLQPDRVIRVGKAKKVYVGAHDHAWDYSLDTVTVPNTMYYQRAILSGSLYAVDLATWVTAGGNPLLFQAPLEKLAQAKEGAVAQWIAHHGPEDNRLPNLASHWADKVENRHPVAAKLAPSTVKAAPTATTAVSPTPPAATPAPVASTKAGS